MDLATDSIFLLEWWIRSGLPLKYTEGAIHAAIRCERLDVLDWWFISGLELKYDHRSMDAASELGGLRALQRWLRSGLELKYTEAAIEGAIENRHTDILAWWLASGLELKYHNPSLVFGGDDFSSYIQFCLTGEMSLSLKIQYHLLITNTLHQRAWREAYTSSDSIREIRKG